MVSVDFFNIFVNILIILKKQETKEILISVTQFCFHIEITKQRCVL